MLQNNNSVMDTPLRPKPLSFTNGALKRHPTTTTTTISTSKQPLYKECLRNHAASLGGHALDGCCEFMPSPLSSPSDPSSLKCAACGCHRNFHRRDDDGDGDDDDDNDDHSRSQNQNPTSPSPLTLSAPHMLLALSAGGHSTPPTHDEANGGVNPVAMVVRKRFRTKFTREQKEKMQELSERLGWKMRKQDEGLVEELCKEIGVGKDVFKVWMHNNKSTFMKRDSNNNNINHGDNNVRDDGAVMMTINNNNSTTTTTNNNCNGNGNGSSNTHLMNGSSSSS
ncbi:hypothetical protein AAC387_Pa11g2279 [Persea americana]